MSQRRTDSSFKEWGSGRRALVITKDLQWTVPLAHAGFDDLTILEWGDEELHVDNLAPGFDLVVVQPGEISAEDLNRWLRLGQSVLADDGSLALGLTSTRVTTGKGGPDGLSRSDAAMDWQVLRAELIGELAVLLLRSANGANPSGVPEVNLNWLLAVCQTAQEACELPLHREIESQSRAIVAMAEKRSAAESRADQAERRMRSAQREARDQAQRRELADARVRSLESSRWFLLAQRYRRLLGREDQERNRSRLTRRSAR